MDRPQYRALLEDIRQDIAGILKRREMLDRELDGARTVEQYLASKLGEAPIALPEAAVAALTSPVTTDTPESRQEVDSVKMTRVDIAAMILRDAGRPLKIGEIIDEMHSRGFPALTDRRIMFNSVYTSMKKAKNRFRKIGHGLWTLNEDQGYEAGGSAPYLQRPTREQVRAESDRRLPCPPYVECAESAIRTLGRPARTGEVAEWIIERGYKDRQKKQLIANTLYNIMSDSDKFVRVAPGLFDLTELAATRDVRGSNRQEAERSLFGPIKETT